MTNNLASSDWATARGDKWRDQLSGMEPMLAPVNEPLIRALQLDAPYRIADIGCGGGGSTRAIAGGAPAGSTVHGFDISPALIDAARDREQMRNANDKSMVSFSVADVATAPVPELPFDRLTSRFGIMFFDDPLAAFGKLAQWLAPGGRFAFAVWAPSSENPLMTSARDAMAGIIDVPSGDPEAPGPFRYAGGDKLTGLLDQAGFSDIQVNDWRGALPLGGGLPAAEAMRFALSAFSTGDLLADADESVHVAVQQSLTALYARHEQDGIVRMDVCIHIVTGTRD